MRTRVVLVLALLMVAALPAARGAATVMCLGREATKVGTTGADTIDGTAGDDVLVGLGGSDTINGYGGNDRICGGGGNDTISPGPGNDRVQGGAGNDIIAGGIGADVLRGGGGADDIHGNDGNDRLLGGAGDDTLNGDAGTDAVTGGLGTDTCYGETLATCELPAAARDFASGTVHQELSTNDDAVSTITVPGSGTITDLNLGIVISHTWVGDLVVILTHVDTGTAVTVIDRPGTTVLPPPGSSVGDFGCGNNNVDAILDDEASALVEDMCRSTYPAISGSVRPNNLLSAFDGEDMSGTWRLTVYDGATLDNGYLESWSLHFTT